MDSKTLATVIASAPGTVKHVNQRNWYQLIGAKGARVYIEQPRKTDGTSRVVELSSFGYNGLPAHLALPAEAVKPITTNGAVSMRVDLDKAPSDWLARLVAALPEIEQEANPRTRSRRRATAPAPDLGQLVRQTLAQAVEATEAHASSDASEPASSDDSSDDSPIGDEVDELGDIEGDDSAVA
jgi:hypothetical protein